MAPPSVYDTHCEGPGLSPSTTAWSNLYCQFRRFTGDSNANEEEPPQIDLTGKTVIISGANSGIGYEAALLSARWGANVVLACRDPPPHENHPEKCIEDIVAATGCPKDRLEWWEVDYSKLKTVHAFGKRWQESGRTCDYLFNNAGLSTSHALTEDGFDLSHQVLFLAHFLTTFYVLPSMKKAKAPRIVNTASCFHYGGFLDFANFNFERKIREGPRGVTLYCTNKLLVMMGLTKELQARLSRSEDYRHVIVQGVHPGFVASNIWHTTKTLPQWMQTPLQWALRNIAINTQQGSLALTWAGYHHAYGFPAAELEAGYPAVGKSAEYGGKYINRITESDPRPEVFDVLARSRLWQRVLEDLKIKEHGLAQDLPGHLPEVI
ncbi:hypothetical protein OC834_005036 [Tilletia horrida]|uniref:NAD(P)-binding protein n=1 Tax=Tilletia horrida TaxID=155126 RepID=A0AAN6GCA5_9BASI|nr:hypothetical protein OC834_005036 [Tilletia horrida]KAK0530374.1 hypothetical protein OC835_004030 [Tilletia horrida]KAK0533432.1 hypothetical protein OC842_002973 [Tilletia horrida]KAK0560232.1 hypothetical protein OC844_003897 [Tilletia horrida]